MTRKSNNLYELLPEIYRVRDAQQGYPLREFLELISEQVDIVKRDIDGLWDDLFVETCRPWVVPYIGDLVGNVPIHDVDGRRRADVAKTIYYRRRKGTLPIVEEIARDVTGWSARAVAFVDLLAWTQNVNHLRRSLAPEMHRRVADAVDRVGTAHVRNVDAMDLVDGPFDVTAHTVDVRPLKQTEGWHNIRKLGVFLWRLQSYPLVGVTPRKAEQTNDRRFHFSPLGNQAPLFNRPRREADRAGQAAEIHVAGPIRPLAFRDRPLDYYGPDKSVAIYESPAAEPEKLVSADDVVAMDLCHWQEPPNGKVAIDFQRGRLAFAADRIPAQGVTVDYSCGFSADLGGGPYGRRDTLDSSDHAWKRTVRQVGEADHASLSKALQAWADSDDAGKDRAIIVVADNATYHEAISVELADGDRLTIQAEDGFRPHLWLEGSFSVTGTGQNSDSALTVNGLLIEGQIELKGTLGELNLLHATLVPPGAQPDPPAIFPGDPKPKLAALRIEIESSILGSLRLPAEMEGLSITDSIIHAPNGTALAGPASGDFGPPVTLEQTTVFGRIHVKELTLASQVIFTEQVKAERRQAGCVRFSFLPDTISKTPRRYRCQPDLALEAVASQAEKDRIRKRLKPAFSSVQYGDPDYAQLSLNCPEEILTGAEDGLEMGAFQQLKHPHRVSNLQTRLEEYLPFGLEAELIYVT